MNDSIFPKRIGIIFLEKLKKVAYKQKYKPKHSKDLEFDQVACAHLILQMNSIQSLFDFQIITLFEEEDKEFYIGRENITLDDFDKEIAKMEELAKDEDNKNKNKKKFKNIDYWIGITSKKIKDDEGHDGHFLATLTENGESQKLVGLITSKDWNKNFSPPSLFEYIALSVYICGIYFLNYHYKGSLRPHKDKGCIFDYTYYKPNKRISISNPGLCIGCNEELEDLELKIDGNLRNKKSNLLRSLESVLNNTWMGNPDEPNTPFYNLKRNYRYDIHRNSGFHKGQIEKFRDSIIDNLPQWTVGTVIAGIIGTILAIFGFK